MGIFQLNGAELVDREIAALCGLELIQPLVDRQLCHLHHIDDLPDSAPEVVHTSGQDQGSTADARRTSTSDHPVAAHPLDNPDRFAGNLHHRRAKL